MKAVAENIFYMFAISFLLVPIALANEHILFTKVVIEQPFHDLLSSHHEFMRDGGARLFEAENGSLALIGIGKVFPDNLNAETVTQARRSGEILARTAILELGGDIEITTVRGMKETLASGTHHGKTISFSSLFQVTETRVEALIQQMPIIGTWWSHNQSTFYVAVGKNAVAGDHQEEVTEMPSIEKGDDDFLEMEGKEPFVCLLKISPVLRRNGGVRGFLFEDNRKALIAVGSAPLKEGLVKAEKIARLKAIRSLLGLQEGIQLSSVEYLADQESLRLSKATEQLVMISQFLSVQKEQVSGLVKALPIVATWNDSEGQIFYVAIGDVF